VSIDYSRQDVLVFSVGQDDPAATASVNPQIQVARLPTVAEEPLKAELMSFLECVRTRSEPLVGLNDGRRALALALEILRAIREHGSRLNLNEIGS